MACGDAASGEGVVVELVKSGRAFVKISAPYRSSSRGPDYADVAPLAKALIGANLQRILWGSDWPHPSEPPDRKPNDALLFDLLSEWAPNEATRHRILVENPVMLYGFARSSG